VQHPLRAVMVSGAALALLTGLGTATPALGPRTPRRRPPDPRRLARGPDRPAGRAGPRQL
jgi:hypothetical protein